MPNRPPQAEDLTILHHRDPETYLAVSVAGSADVTLTLDQCLATALEFTGAITANISVIFPLIAQNVGKTWRLKNSTTGAFTVTAKVTSQTGFVVERGEMSQAVANGTDLYRSSPEKLSRRYQLQWVAGLRGKPAINADIQDTAESTHQIADPDFEVLGTNADTSTVTFNAEGGVKLTTKTSANDQVIVLPHLDTSQSGWTQITWGTDQETQYEAHIKTGAAITSTTIWVGLKLTNTSVTATDDDQVFVRYDSATNSGKWQAIDSIGGTDVATDTGITVVLSTEYHIRIAIDSSRIARVYINGQLVRTTTPLTDATDFKPYVGVQTTTTAAKHILLFGQAISRKYA
jgi:hypothetical protein